MLHDAMLRRATRPPCSRCNEERTESPAWRQNITVDPDGYIVHRNWLCPACVADYGWFLDMPPEIPLDISSGIVLETDRLEDDAEDSHDRS